ncbi:MAG: bifunctional diaminohydroxyphosphoribosylaminopyrimidine deaminase/5-amino-6-(5-phosphoribosylamino)uracil reductase RibD [Neisseriaceae bacterium]|nr:bifunctional diaminohydroxyphosphoribosylaminopyrimidine deaminase/5-amino-6-(5-phosphoribosylamino)uracil reductase RibD [Neisseriaceae bacterium]
MMCRALHLAEKGRNSTSPNPRVGCVISKDEQIIGEGFHLQAGTPHAEVHALAQAGEAAAGATAYVTLEPCSHYGRTPPCAQALIDAKVSRVVMAQLDPNPLVAGNGQKMLAQAGIDTQVGLLEEDARALNRGFLSRIERQRPFIFLKCAASLDGKTALNNGASQWITGPEARQEVQLLRAQSCAVLTGVGTVLADDPRLNVRTLETLRQPTRVVLDTHLRTPLTAHIVDTTQAPTLIMTAITDPAQHQPYIDHGVQVVMVAQQGDHLDLLDAVTKLAALGIGELMIEAGNGLNGAFLQANLVDEIVLFQAPKILGHHAQGLFSLPEATELATCSQWVSQSLTLVGADSKWVLHPQPPSAL